MAKNKFPCLTNTMKSSTDFQTTSSLVYNPSKPTLTQHWWQLHPPHTLSKYLQSCIVAVLHLIKPQKQNNTYFMESKKNYHQHCTDVYCKPLTPFQNLANLLNWCSFEDDDPPVCLINQWVSDLGLSSHTLVTLHRTQQQSQSCTGFT